MLRSSVHASQTEQIAAQLCRELGPRAGDVVLLRGEVGCGKSVFARGFIRQACQDPALRVQSPTFLLQQEYVTNAGLVVNHFDLYRFEPSMTLVDAKALDWENCLTNGVSLVEWPERIQANVNILLPSKLRYIHVTLSMAANAKGEEDEDEVRHIEITRG